MAEDKVNTEEDEVCRHAVIEEKDGQTEAASDDAGINGVDGETVDKRV